MALNGLECKSSSMSIIDNSNKKNIKTEMDRKYGVTANY
jgi:hypothetical protein